MPSGTKCPEGRFSALDEEDIGMPEFDFDEEEEE